MKTKVTPYTAVVHVAELAEKNELTIHTAGEAAEVRTHADQVIIRMVGSKKEIKLLLQKLARAIRKEQIRQGWNNDSE